MRRIGIYTPRTIGGLVLTLMALPTLSQARMQPPEPPAEVKEAFDTCFKELGIAPPTHEKKAPSQEERERLHACIESKGANFPPPPPELGPDGFRMMRKCLAEQGIALPEPKTGEFPPMPDEKTRNAIESCRSQIENRHTS